MKSSNNAARFAAIAFFAALPVIASPTPAPTATPPRLTTKGGHGAGNGGGGEPLFHSMADALSGWLTDRTADASLEEKLQLREAGVSATEIVRSFEDAKSKARVKFVAAAKLEAECRAGDSLACSLRDSSRTCRNDAKPDARIVCNEDLFDARPGDEQFVLVFHEYLGIAGIETSDEEDFSLYPISRYLLRFARPRTVVRWELDAEAAKPSVLTGCKVYVQGGHKALLLNGYEITRRKKDADFVLSYGDYSGFYGTRTTSGGYSTSRARYVVLTHKSGFSRKTGVDIHDFVGRPAYIQRAPENQAVDVELAAAKSAPEYARIREKLRPELDIQFPALNVAENMLLKLPPCGQMYGR